MTEHNQEKCYKDKVWGILIISFLVEAFTLCTYAHLGYVAAFSIFHLLGGLCLCGSAFYLLKEIEPVNTANHVYLRSSQLAVSLLIIFVFQYAAERGFAEVPIDYRVADMLPVMKIMSERYLAGQDVYAMIYEIWDGTKPIYLPAMWMPFLPAVWLDIDMRWIPMGMFLIGFLAMWLVSVRFYHTYQAQLSIAAVMFLLVLLISHYFQLFTLTEEGLIIGYYLLLAAALILGRPIWIGIFIGCCLMSRFSLVFWLLIVVAVLVKSGYVSALIKIMVYSAGIVIVWLSIGNAWVHLPMFLDLPSHYIDAMLANPDKYNPEIAFNMGVAKFFGLMNIPILQKVALVSSLFCAIGLCIWYTTARFKEPWFYLLVALKLCLVMFYNFLILPYSYLFFVSTFISAAIILGICGRFPSTGKLSVR